MTSGEYKLSVELRGHTEDVRGLCVCGDQGIATASRDKTVKFWKQESQGSKYVLDKTFVGHTSFVGAVAWIHANQEFPGGALVSGGMDKKVLVWDVTTAAVIQDLQGHQEQVTDVAVTCSEDLVSASLDKTVRVWRKGQCMGVLTGHESSVLAVLPLPSGDIVTASADCSVKVWRNGSCVHTVKAHTDTVRSLALMPGVGILSASHDGSVKLWTEAGELLLEMHGHTALVYSVTAGAGGEVTSGSEDNTAKVWRDGVCQQSIEHPGCVWDVAYLPSGDLVTACSDGVARVWTREAARVASAEERANYEAVIRAGKKSKMVGGVKVEDLPGVEALNEPGKKDGQTKIVREGDSGVAYSWNAKEFNWDRIGEVVDGPGDNLQQNTLHGASYDYVFDVDIGDGVPPRKLPYNRGQNPYDVADRWLEDEGLPAGYREQVVEFILRNTGQAAPMVLDNKFYDPYTGGQAYVPAAAGGAGSAGQSARATGGAATWTPNADPFTGGAAYNPTGASRAAPPAATPAAAPPSLSHIPKKGYLLFESAQYEGILKKLLEFTTALQAPAQVDETSKEDAPSVSAETYAQMEAIVATLKDTSRFHASNFADADFQLLLRLVVTWPPQYLFPVLDVLRMLALHPQAAAKLAELGTASPNHAQAPHLLPTSSSGPSRVITLSPSVPLGTYVSYSPPPRDRCQLLDTQREGKRDARLSSSNSGGVVGAYVSKERSIAMEAALCFLGAGAEQLHQTQEQEQKQRQQQLTRRSRSGSKSRSRSNRSRSRNRSRSSIASSLPEGAGVGAGAGVRVAVWLPASLGISGCTLAYLDSISCCREGKD